MRSLAVITVLVASTSIASADNFVEIAGGIMIPVEDEDWTDYVESSPKLATRIGGAGQDGRVGGLLSVDWTPVNTDVDGLLGGAVESSAHRFRILANVLTQHHIGPRLALSARLGAGVDIAYVRVRENILGTERSDTDSGLAIEAGFGLWFDLGSMKVGGELAFPLSFHSDGPDDDIDLRDYTSFDIDLLFGVRFVSR